MLTNIFFCFIFKSDIVVNFIQIIVILLLYLYSENLLAEEYTFQQLMDSTNFYQEKQDFHTGLEWAFRAEAKAKEQFGEKDTNYVVSLQLIEQCYYYMGSAEKALGYSQRIKMITTEIIGKDNPKYAEVVLNLGFLYNSLARYSEAEPLYVEALEIFRRLFKDDHPSLANSINNIASFYYGQGRFVEAEPLLIEALEMRRRLFKGDHPDLVTSINNMAAFYNTLSRYTEAEPLYKEALEMRRRLFKGDHPDLAMSINSMAFFYYYTLGKYAEAEPLYKEALSMYQRLFKGDHPSLANSMINMAWFYNEQGRYAEAEPLYKEALSMYQRLFKGDHPSLANSISNMAWFYNEQGRYAEAEPLYREALEMSRRLFKGDHHDLANSIGNMARFYDAQSRYAEAEPLYLEALQIYTKVLENYFPSLSEKEKQQFWNTIRHNFARFNIFAIKRANENPSILCKMYDNQLLTKGLLFNSAVKIKTRISNSGDTSLIKLYNRWKDTRELLVKLYKKSESELKNQKINRDSIEQYANSLEKEISLKSENYKQSYEKKKVSWKAIQTLLKPDEAALEVIRIRYYDKFRSIDSVYYACLIVNEQTEENPELVLLEDGKKLEGEYYQSYREAIKKKQKDIKSYNRYWSKLEEKLKGYKKIYFSADGVYNKINPSTLMMPDGKYLLDIQDIQQINSTKDILLGYYQKKEESNMYNSAVLVGNPNFALSEEQVKNISKTIRGEAREEGTTKPTTIERGITLKRLPGTEKEIKEIEKFLRSKKWEVKSYLDDMAVKGAVKSANSPRVLHIATHGLFSEDIEKSGKEVFGFEEKKLSENPLLRSGLFFSGAENNINKIGERENQEDSGILTAYEAMNLNLDRTELVVLSACETGLGDIRNGEGVFGLRRAFQQAGAKSLIMSLWTVSDEATQELMSKFYKNWVEGMSKRESFKKAQQEVRSKYPAPYFWGAFVMVGE